MNCNGWLKMEEIVVDYKRLFFFLIFELQSREIPPELRATHAGY